MRSRVQVWLWLVTCVVLGQVGGVRAAVLTVGPGGTHPSFQAAVNAASANPEADEIRLLGEVLVGQANIVVNASSGSLAVSGGWNASFTARVADGLSPFATVINANEAGTGLRIVADAGLVELSGFRVTYGVGSDPSTGGNLTADIGGTAQLHLTDVHFRQGAASHVGAGAFITLAGAATAQLRDCSFANNRINAVSGSYFGAGLALSAFDSTVADLARVSIFANEGIGATQGNGTGLRILARNSSLVIVTDSDIGHNSSTSSSSSAAISIQSQESSLVDLQRMRIAFNSATAPPSSQVFIDERDAALVYLTDSLVNDSTMLALRASTSGTASPSGSVRFNNLTITRNSAPGGFAAGGDNPITLYNSIVHDNGSGFLPAVGSNNLGSNLGLAAPTFVGPSDYHLAAGSAGIDAGNSLVPGGLGVRDADGNPRVHGAEVDIGAYEYRSDEILHTGFE